MPVVFAWELCADLTVETHLGDFLSCLQSRAEKMPWPVYWVPAVLTTGLLLLLQLLRELILQRHCSKHAAHPRPLMHAPADRICLRAPCGMRESLQRELLTNQMLRAVLIQLG